jgi:hypothetical protein
VSIGDIDKALGDSERRTQNVIDLSVAGKEQLPQVCADIDGLLASLDSFKQQLADFLQNSVAMRTARSAFAEAHDNAILAESDVVAAFTGAEHMEPVLEISGSLQEVTEYTAGTKEEFYAIFGDGGALKLYGHYRGIRETLKSMQEKITAVESDADSQSGAATSAKSKIVDYRRRLTDPLA